MPSQLGIQSHHGLDAQRYLQDISVSFHQSALLLRQVDQGHDHL